jgi:hypothetical protein
METGNVDVVLMRTTANECNAATEHLARYLDTELPATEESLTARELLAAFLNDLSNECLTRWGPSSEATSTAAQLNHSSRQARGRGRVAQGKTVCP